MAAQAPSLITRLDASSLKATIEGHRRYLQGLPGGRRASLPYTDLRNCVLEGEDLREIDLTGALLSGALMAGVQLGRATLFGCDLRNADLRGADLAKADLRGACLRGANLSMANLPMMAAAYRGTRAGCPWHGEASACHRNISHPQYHRGHAVSCLYARFGGALRIKVSDWLQSSEPHRSGQEHHEPIWLR